MAININNFIALKKDKFFQRVRNLAVDEAERDLIRHGKQTIDLKELHYGFHTLNLLKFFIVF